VRVFTTLLLLASIAVLAGCSKKEEAAVPPPQAQPAPQPAPTPSSNALPSTQGELPGLTLTIQELKRSSNALTLKFVLQSKNGMAFGYDFGEGDKEFGNIAGIDAGVSRARAANRTSSDAPAALRTGTACRDRAQAASPHLRRRAGHLAGPHPRPKPSPPRSFVLTAAHHCSIEYSQRAARKISNKFSPHNPW